MAKYCTNNLAILSHCLLDIITTSCPLHRSCIIDKRQRNRCQFCRYMKCLEMGMKREAVQEERNRGGGGGGGGAGSVPRDSSIDIENLPIGNPASEMPMERIVNAENVTESYYSISGDRYRHGETSLTSSTTRERMLHQLLNWAKQIPHFNDLKTEDQVTSIDQSL